VIEYPHLQLLGAEEMKQEPKRFQLTVT
jgi:hypothetical protein